MGSISSRRGEESGQKRCRESHRCEEPTEWKGWLSGGSVLMLEAELEGEMVEGL